MLKRLLGAALAAALLSGCGTSPRPELPANAVPAAALATEATATAVAAGISAQLDAGAVTPKRAAEHRERLITAQSVMLAGRAAYDARLAWRGETVPTALLAARASTDEQLAGLFARLAVAAEAR